MDGMLHNDFSPTDIENLADGNSLIGIIVVLGELKPAAIITEEGVARLFSRHVASVKRAIQRGELPPPTRLFGQNVWTVGTLIRYIENRLDQAAKDAERTAHRIAMLSDRLSNSTKVKYGYEEEKNGGPNCRR
jgi:hypothetical protein